VTVKRHPALQPLSRDHLIALLHSYRLVQAASGNERFNLDTSIHDFKAAWKSEIAIHFADEERLFPELPISEISLRRLFDEHKNVRALVLELHLNPNAAVAASLGETLEAHIRWEERTLFPEIETALSPVQLGALQAEGNEIELSRKRKHVVDEAQSEG